MDKGKRKLATTLLAAASLTTAASLHASVTHVSAPGETSTTFTETGDAGQTLATAQPAGTVNGTTGLTQINGTIAGTNGLDADVYSFTLTAASTLTFTATSTAGIDTSLFLFSSTGVPILANDDQSNTSFQAKITTGLLAAGNYFLGVSLSGNEPVNTNNQLLFTLDQPTTNLRGPASGLNPTTLSTFNGGTFFAEGGAYSIGVSAVPEPTTTAALGLGGIASLVLLRRARRQQKA